MVHSPRPSFNFGPNVTVLALGNGIPVVVDDRRFRFTGSDISLVVSVVSRSGPCGFMNSAHISLASPFY